MKNLKKQVKLIGTDHEVQWNEELSKADNLHDWLTKMMKSSSIDFIAEEFSEEVLVGLPNGVKNTIAQKVAEKFNITHKFCDPDSEVREKMGYPSKNQLQEKFGYRSVILGTAQYKKRKKYETSFWHIREKYWLNQINNGIAKNIIFICGSDHLKGFKPMLIESGYSVVVGKI